MPIVITGFSGGGGADLGYIAAGFTPSGAVEYDPAIAEVYRANIGPDVRCESIMDTNWATFDRPDLLHMSPECKEFSTANQDGSEGPTQLAQAAAIVDALTTLTPRLFVLENVVAYRKSKSLARILVTLTRLGYQFTLHNLNSADFGVPQTRMRLILRAVRGSAVPPLPTPTPWIGWYAAIEDMLPTLPTTKFAPWQELRIRPPVRTVLIPGGNGSSGVVRGATEPAATIDMSAAVRAFIVSDQQGGQIKDVPGRGLQVRYDDEPIFTQTTRSTGGSLPRAFIVDGQTNENGRTLTIRDGERPMFTISASASKRPARAWLDEGRVVGMTPRAIARFMGIPDSYQLPEKQSLALKVLGNAVCPPLAQAIGESLLPAIRR